MNALILIVKNMGHRDFRLFSVYGKSLHFPCSVTTRLSCNPYRKRNDLLLWLFHAIKRNHKWIKSLLKRAVLFSNRCDMNGRKTRRDVIHITVIGKESTLKRYSSCDSPNHRRLFSYKGTPPKCLAPHVVHVRWKKSSQIHTCKKNHFHCAFQAWSQQKLCTFLSTVQRS